MSTSTRAIAIDIAEKINTRKVSAPGNVYRQAALDVVFAEIWTRPGLDFRQRRWLCLAAAGMSGAPVAITNHIYGSVNSGDVSAEEMGEFLLQFACYAGWPRATIVDAALTAALDRVVTEGGHVASVGEFCALRESSLQALVAPGRDVRSAVLGSSTVSGAEGTVSGPKDTVSGTEGTPVSDLLVAGFEYGQTWSRGVLPRSDRRLVTLTCLAVLDQRELLGQHLAAALGVGEFDVAQLREVALHLGFYAGIPVATLIDATIDEVISRSGPSDGGVE